MPNVSNNIISLRIIFKLLKMIRGFVLLMVALACVDAGQVAQVDVDGYSSGVPTVRATCTPTSLLRNICNNCTSYKFCVTETVFSQDLLCPPEKKHCVENAAAGASCSSSPDTNRPICSAPPTPPRTPELDCMAVGSFPDPRVCGAYHYCESAGVKSEVYTCPPLYNFNPVNHTCRMERLQPCMKVDCNTTGSVFHAYGDGLNTYYAVCIDPNIYMFSCPANHQMSYTSNTCEFVCPTTGRFINGADASGRTYYECYLNEDMRVVNRIVQCPGVRTFNIITSSCE